MSLAHANEGEVQEHGAAPPHGGKEERARACTKDRLSWAALLHTCSCDHGSTENVYSVLLGHCYSPREDGPW